LFWYFSLPRKTMLCASDPPSNSVPELTQFQTPCVAINLIF